MEVRHVGPGLTTPALAAETEWLGMHTPRTKPSSALLTPHFCCGCTFESKQAGNRRLGIWVRMQLKDGNIDAIEASARLVEHYNQSYIQTGEQRRGWTQFIWPNSSPAGSTRGWTQLFRFRKDIYINSFYCIYRSNLIPVVRLMRARHYDNNYSFKYFLT